MNSLILTTVGRLLKPLLLLVSIIVLLRGHNEPGGGFVGGLLAAAAFALDAVIGRTSRARRALRISPQLLLGTGLLLAAASGIPALLRGQAILTAQAYEIALPFDLHWALSTVLLFDVGVYIVVMGTVLLIVFTLGEQ
jgi:multicomponent Na+:H+ antiporter subunit B